MRVQQIEPLTGPRIEEQTGFWLRVVAGLLNQGLTRSLKSADINPPEWLALRLIGDSGGLAPSRLAECLATTRGGASKLVTRLEKRGLVQRDVASSDRRGQVLQLTGEGARLANRLAAVAGEAEAAFFRDLSPLDLAALRALLVRAAVSQGHPADCGNGRFKV